MKTSTDNAVTANEILDYLDCANSVWVNDIRIDDWSITPSKVSFFYGDIHSISILREQLAGALRGKKEGVYTDIECSTFGKKVDLIIQA